MSHEDSDEDTPYIDRLVLRVENNVGEDVSIIDAEGEGVDDSLQKGHEGDGKGEIGDSDGNSDWTESDKEYHEDETSDDEMSCDSDEDEDSIMIIKDDYDLSTEPEISPAHLNEVSKLLLLWRLDKDESFSDWIIEVSVLGEGGESKKTLYNVHKSVLGAGPKKSGYFRALFKSVQLGNSNENKSAVELSDEVAADFPVFLDYMYSHPSECDCLIETGNRRSLQHLADYFDVSELRKSIHTFIEDDMHTIEHIQGYLSEFPDAEQNDEAKNVHSIAARVCVKMILHIKDLTVLTPALVLHVFSRIRSSEDIKSLSSSNQHHICRLALDYINHHQNEIDQYYFDALIPDLYFPDDTEHAGLISWIILTFINKTGWSNEDITAICTASLSRYLAAKGWSTDNFAMVDCIPRKALALLCKELMTAMSATEKESETESFNVKCKLLGMLESMPIRMVLGKPEGNILEVSVKPSDSINYIRYLVCREVNCMHFCASMRVLFEGQVLAVEKRVSDCGISSSSVLGIEIQWYPFSTERSAEESEESTGEESTGEESTGEESVDENGDQN